jgi:arylsulfatase A-like enzyme
MTHRNVARKVSALLAATVLASLGLSWGLGQIGGNEVAHAAGKPNILFIILDDVGIDQMSLFGFGGKPTAKLPNIAKLAKRGVKFSNVWAMPECSPSRASFFTGRYPIRTGVQSAIVDNHLPQSYMSSYETTIPRVLTKAGYVSALIGKYHLGSEKDPAGNCAPSTRGWQQFVGIMTPGPPSIDTTAGGGDPSGTQACGYFQTSAEGACYTQKEGVTNCKQITVDNAEANTSPSRTCLQKGGLFRPNLSCGQSPPTADDFSNYNSYYVWPKTATTGPRAADWITDGNKCEPRTDRRYMTEAQSVRAARWWNEQIGPRMMTVAYNTIHTPFQKAPTDIVPDPRDKASTCDPLTPDRPLINNMLESADVEIGRMLADMGLGTLAADGSTLATLDLRNTVVIVVGDNGSLGGTVRVLDGFDPSRSKATVYQTGVWVPLIVSGPIVSQPGRDVDELINIVDLFGLFGDIAGVEAKDIVPPSHTLDSKPIMPYLTAVDAPPVRATNFVEHGFGNLTPVASERSYPCVLASLCTDGLISTQRLCEDNGGTWYGPGGAKQATSCCAVLADPNSGATSMSPVRQFATRNKRFKLVELHQTDCAVPLQPGDSKPFPWAEYNTKSTREFYDLTAGPGNPAGIDKEQGNLLKDCPDGQDPKSCLPKALRPQYTELSQEMAAVQNSAQAQATCRSQGDGNLDLRVNNQDIKEWKKFNGKGPSQYDINQDGQTDEADLAIIQANLGSDCMTLCQRADLDRNGLIDSKDMTLLAQQTGDCQDNLCGGDLDGNGKVDNKDVKLMIQAQNTCTAPKIRGAER